MNRRNILSLLGVGIAGTSGCLRFQDGQNSPMSGGNPSDNDPGEVTLAENWTDENGVDFIWTFQGSFYYNDYNYAAEATHGNGVRWSAETTYDGVDANLGADAFATDGEYLVYGFIPDPEGNEERGGHFHAYQMQSGEKMWVSAGPSDGKHNHAIGATVVDEIAVLATTDYADETEQEPLVRGVDIRTGDIQWEVDQSVLPASIITYLGSYEGNVYVGMKNDGVRVLEGDSGTQIETHETWNIDESWNESLGQIHGDTLFAVWGDRVEAYPIGENGVSWSNTGFDDLFTPPAVDNSLVVVGTEGGDVYALERESGTIRWEASITNSVGAIETTGSNVWVGDTDIGLTAYDRETGSEVHRSAKNVGGDDIAIVDDVLLLGGDVATAYTVRR